MALLRYRHSLPLLREFFLPGFVRIGFSNLKAVIKLLWSTDLDVLENALRLVACFAARNAVRPESSNKTLIVNKNRLWKFVTGEAINSRQAPFPDMKSLLSKQAVIPPNWAGYFFHYYKRAPLPSSSSTASAPPTTIAPRSAVAANVPVIPSREVLADQAQRSGAEATTADGKTTAEGWVRLHLHPDNIMKQGIEATYRELIGQGHIPEEDHGRLFVQILQAYYYNDPARREQFLRCQLHALLSLGGSTRNPSLIVGNICHDSKDLEKHVYSSRQDIIQQMVRLLHNDSEAGLPLKTLVLRVLRTLSRNSLYASNHRSEHSRFQQILTALDSNLNHGILMTLLRENVTFLQNNDPTVDEMNYSQALHRIMREFLESPMGASNLGFAGLVPLLVELLKIERASVWNIAVTTADLVASLIPHYRRNQILPLFIEADGLNTVIHVIRKHVDLNLARPPAPEEEGLHHSLLTFPEHQLLHTFLLLLNRLVKSGHGERVRAVVDSEVIPAIREIFNDLLLFGGYIAWQASKLLSLVLHNEPTSYPALHENGLPQAFLKMVASGIPPVPDFIQTLPTAFDAICINTQGKELFAQYHFKGLFEILKSLEHCRALVKGHAMECGGGMDELLRHHPDLKEPFLQGFKEFLEEVSQIILAEKPEGGKLAEMADVKGAEVADADWRASMRPGFYLTMARLEEERNLPILQRIRAIVHVPTTFPLFWMLTW